MLNQILNQVDLVFGLFIKTFCEDRIKFRVFPAHLRKKGLFPPFTIFIDAVIISFYFFNIIIDLYFLDGLQEHVEVEIQTL